MHEVLAPILWVNSREIIDPESLEKLSGEEPQEYSLICECCDMRFLEHDTFTVFAIIMQTMKSFYETGTNTQISPSLTPHKSPIFERIERIHEVYLRQADPELADHLVVIEILPQIFLLRWIRLLFGREFPLDHVLSVWDVLFAEDPKLDVIDLVCVSMLLRIRHQPFPNGPHTFVDDALYLRRNIAHAGGSHIIDKYSEQAAGTEKGSKVRKSRSAKRVKQLRKPEGNKSQSPSLSTSRFLQEEGGIDTIIQEAAKGVYSRSEKWGVNKALRSAVESLQSGTNYSQRQLDGSRWSLGEGAHVPSVPKLTADIKSLEERSKGLAKLLENALGELWEQQRQHSNEKEESFANALSLAIAKIQFVQVYLENPTMPFTVENPESATGPAKEHGNLASGDTSTHLPSLDERPPQKIASQESTRLQIDPDEALEEHGAPTNSAPEIKVSKVRQQNLPFHHPRPSLAQSSFSWMLGEDQRKSSFVSPSPFPSERRAAREKADFLFGEGKANTEGKAHKAKSKEESEDEEVINLGTLKGRR
ncbi:MAG: hypothetical protein Q9170_004025 [Blastenia crenularia]